MSQAVVNCPSAFEEGRPEILLRAKKKGAVAGQKKEETLLPRRRVHLVHGSTLDAPVHPVARDLADVHAPETVEPDVEATIARLLVTRDLRK